MYNPWSDGARPLGGGKAQRRRQTAGSCPSRSRSAAIPVGLDDVLHGVFFRVRLPRVRLPRHAAPEAQVSEAACGCRAEEIPFYVFTARTHAHAHATMRGAAARCAELGRACAMCQETRPTGLARCSPVERTGTAMAETAQRKPAATNMTSATRCIAAWPHKARSVGAGGSAQG